MTRRNKNISAPCRSGLLAIAITAFATPVSAQGLPRPEPLGLETPVACRVPDECAVQNYFDHEDDPTERDSDCGPLTYDGHRGTDFALPDLNAMRRGVPVLAAAAGTVLRVRDGEPDVHPGERAEASLRGREAGNSVILDHGNGWQTQYSHMRLGSVAVRPGDHVGQGDQLGLIGQSGNAEFPHLHFEVRRHGRAIDPYTGPAGTCGDFSAALWDDDSLAALAYRPTGLVRAGFARETPQIEVIRGGGYTPDLIPPQPETLTFWAQIYGLQKGDVMRIEVLSATGETVAQHKEVAPRHRARQMWFTGAHRPRQGWPRGALTGYFELQRDGVPIVAVRRVLERR